MRRWALNVWDEVCYDCDEKMSRQTKFSTLQARRTLLTAAVRRETLLSALYVRRIKGWSASTRMPPQDAVSLPGFIIEGGPVQR